MRKLSKSKPRLRQVTPEDLVDSLLEFLNRKFYGSAHPARFHQDRRRLLQWVVLWPAKWLDDRGVSITPDRYREIFMSVFMDGLNFGNTENISYLPAWLAKVIQSHFAHHGDEIYEQAKSIRSVVEHTSLILGRLQPPTSDPVRDLANASRLLKPKKKSSSKPPVKAQLPLL